MENKLLLHLSVMKQNGHFLIGFNGYIFKEEKGKTKNKLPTILFTNVGIVDKKTFKIKENLFEIETDKIIEGYFISEKDDDKFLILLLENLKETYNIDNIVLIVNNKIVNSFFKILPNEIQESMSITVKYSTVFHSYIINITELLTKLALNIFNDAKLEIFIKSYDIKDYFSKPDPDPFIHGRQLLFTVKEHRDYYYILNYEKEKEIGKKINTVLYSIYNPKEKDYFIELLKTEFREWLGTLSLFANIYYKKLMDRTVMMFLNKYGVNCLVKSTRHMKSLNFLDGEPLVAEIYPPGLAFKAIENCEYLEKELNNFLDNNLPTYEKILDITDYFYIKDNKDKTILNPELTTINKTIKIKYKETTFPIIIGDDILDRNKLKKIEKMNPKIFMMITEDEISYNYKLILKTDEISELFANIYSNTIYKRKKKK